MTLEATIVGPLVDAMSGISNQCLACEYYSSVGALVPNFPLAQGVLIKVAATGISYSYVLGIRTTYSGATCDDADTSTGCAAGCPGVSFVADPSLSGQIDAIVNPWAYIHYILTHGGATAVGVYGYTLSAAVLPQLECQVDNYLNAQLQTKSITPPVHIVGHDCPFDAVYGPTLLGTVTIQADGTITLT